MRPKIERSRLYIVLAGIMLLFGAITWRLADIGLWRHDWYAQTAAAQASGTANVLLRGNIYMQDKDKGKFLVATNRRMPDLSIVSTKVPHDAAQAAIDQLTRITSLDRAVVEKAVIGGASGSRVLLHKLTDDQVSAINEMKVPGISVGYETGRAYPAGTLAADVVGFYGYSQQGRAGQYGVEASFDSELSGTREDAAPTRMKFVDYLKSLIGKDTVEDVTAAKPDDVELTIDKNIQSYIESALADVLRKYSAASGVIIVQEPKTGRILGLADSPTFDPNNYGSYPVQSFLNGAITPFEPGSSFKPFTMAMGIDNGKVTPDTIFDDSGDVVVDGYTIKNFNEGHFGKVTMTQVLEKSINTGVMYVQSLLTHDQFLHGVVDMGFGQKTGIDLPGESPGNIDNLYTGRKINFMTASFGQGITVTPLQLITGYSAIANGGKFMKPYIVESVDDSSGNRTVTKPEIVGTPFSQKTAQQLSKMLVSVVDKGFDKARIPRYDVAGKTGTAQIASPDGGYLAKQYNHSFVGFAPASDPRFTIFIKMERPQGITFAADSLSPVFKDIALFLLNYMNVPPTR